MCLTLANAQDYPRERIDLSKLTDNILTWQDEDIGYEEIYENYVQLYANPIDLNTASFDDLHLINILTDNQINQLLEYRKENGALLSVYELQSVPGFDLQAIQNLIPFVIINKTTTSHSILDRITNNRNSYLIWRYEKTLESSDGFNTPNPEQRFKGSPDKLYLRFRNSRPNDYSFGLTAEKDAGEQLLWRPGSNQYGSDFLSYHLQLSNKRKLKTLVLGDYQCQFGQGLILGNTFGLGKGGEPVITTRKSNIGFLPYTSVNEANYMRGIATTYQLSNNIFVSAMYSNTYRDASVDGDEVPTFSSINITGLHRNEKEIQNRKQVKEQVSAGIINYRNKTIDAGIIFQKINFSIPISKDANAYNQHTFKGDENINTSFFFNYTTQNFNFFSEAAKSLDGGLGIITGALASLHEDLDMALIYRKYDPDFYPFYGNGFSESTITQNENGFYWGFKYRLDRKYSIAAYADLFSFPWNRYRVYKPSNGHEYLLRINYQPTKKVLAFIQFRQETKMRNVADQQNLYSIGTGIKRNLWINTDYYVTPKVRMKTRAQFSTYSLDNEITKGIALVQDLQIDLGKLEVSARHALFDTDNYDNRQYIYENDVWLAYSLPALEGTGIRNYIMLEYKVSKWLSLWLRFAKTRYSNKDEIGSGIQRINGNTKNDIKLQAVLHF
ncbi:helix-hairpin-helix domain-containing protein [Chryseosolibacter indicus]|uniref:Helix-hairpin-helix domain-containing protein n=1 Tax=Chryseosolibacter indicus TaxID=2782351 RepID=A0ABS5VVL1_9BACT|nr:helix-hairpin-helix domain-containing protein [Chryseosolibacter indicus]MBT1705478.1 helix-hairpin-helix domain-containing protein [Chryseosolibacter indicus]